MNVEKYLLKQIRKCRRKMILAKCIDSGVLFAAAGGIGGILCELLSLFRQFYYVHLAAGLCFGAGILIGIGYALYKRASMEQAAMMLDSFGLEERMITAYEQIKAEECSPAGNAHGKGISAEKEPFREKENARENIFIQLQRQDALSHYDKIREQIRIPLFPDKRHILALLLSAAVVIGMAFIPSPVRRQAQLSHQVQEQAKEELEELEDLLEALEEVDLDSLTEEEKLQLQALAEALQLSREELMGADSWESLASAMDRLDYKYGQTAQGLENLGALLDDPEKAGIAAAEAMAKAAVNSNGSQMASSGTPSAGSAGSGENGEGSSESGSGSDSGNGQGDGSEGGNGSEQGKGSGNGNGNGQGNGSGNGSGNGQGNGNGSGQGGSGRGTGSSDAIHDYVSIPNALGEDPSLTGTQYGNQDSDYYRQQNGLAWEGEHVEYSSVIGEYTDSAYEGLTNGKYPSGMESVIRDYFGSLNQ